jgi:hypothetical protein
MTAQGHDKLYAAGLAVLLACFFVLSSIAASGLALPLDSCSL